MQQDRNIGRGEGGGSGELRLTTNSFCDGGNHEEPLREFIASLDPDWERAGEIYEAQRQSLKSFFRKRRCSHSEELADEVLDRAARKFREARDLRLFLRGIARRVASEHFRKTEHIPLNSICEPGDHTRPTHFLPDSADRLSTLDQLLEELSPPDREMLLGYYRFHGSQKIKNRRCLAESLNISLDALAVRALRARRTLLKAWPLDTVA